MSVTQSGGGYFFKEEKGVISNNSPVPPLTLTGNKVETAPCYASNKNSDSFTCVKALLKKKGDIKQRKEEEGGGGDKKGKKTQLLSARLEIYEERAQTTIKRISL